MPAWQGSHSRMVRRAAAAAVGTRIPLAVRTKVPTWAARPLVRPRGAFTLLPSTCGHFFEYRPVGCTDPYGGPKNRYAGRPAGCGHELYRQYALAGGERPGAPGGQSREALAGPVCRLSGGASGHWWVHAGSPKHLPARRHLSGYAGRGRRVRLPVAQEGPLDFATFLADEHRGLLKLLDFATGNRAEAAMTRFVMTGSG